MKSVLKNKIKQDLQGLGNKYEVVVHGSQVLERTRPNSDIDIAIITRIREEKKNIDIWKDLLEYNVNDYDIKIFELLPLRIKISIIYNYEVIFGDSLEISEYFYPFRGMWDDCKHRIFANQFKNIQKQNEQRKKYLALHKA